MPGLRQSRKVPRSEWASIAARAAQREPAARIGRDYGVTPPAIRYIVKQHEKRSGQFEGSGEVRACLMTGIDEAREVTAGEIDPFLDLGKTAVTEMASFVVAIAAADPDSPESLVRLRDATDAVLRCAALVLIQMERAKRRGAPIGRTRSRVNASKASPGEAARNGDIEPIIGRRL
jgi:hypothetical protein